MPTTNTIVFIADVSKGLGLGKSTLYKMINAGEFPPGKLIGGRKKGWLRSDVDAFILAWANKNSDKKDV